jgi:hypothetical protein
MGKVLTPLTPETNNIANQNFTNDCLVFAEYMTLGKAGYNIEKVEKLKLHGYLREIKSGNIFGGSDSKNIELAKKVEKKFKYTESDIIPGRSIAIVRKKIIPGHTPYHIAYIVSVNEKGITTLEADAGDTDRNFFDLSKVKEKYKKFSDFRKKYSAEEFYPNSVILILELRQDIDELLEKRRRSSRSSSSSPAKLRISPTQLLVAKRNLKRRSRRISPNQLLVAKRSLKPVFFY